MKKAGIITLSGEYNFGNRLQNYAVQQVLQKYHLNVETIKYLGLNEYKPPIENGKDKERLKKFREFNQQIKFADQILYKECDVPKNFSDNYDYIVMGSDQIWNFTFDKIFSDKALGAFAPKNKKISFSASFGVSYVPEKNSELYDMCKKYLNDIKSISVREDAGKEIVKELTGREDVQVLIDPTMMLDSQEWEKVMKKPRKQIKGKFILKSFLGSFSDSAWQELKRIADENECEIIDISDKKSPFYNVGPAEFLYLEKNAFLVATDSFHSCVFATLFSTPFIVFKREDNQLESMHSRIETLLGKFGMENRIFNEKIEEELLHCDFEKVYEILEEERKKVNTFLENALIE